MDKKVVCIFSLAAMVHYYNLEIRVTCNSMCSKKVQALICTKVKNPNYIAFFYALFRILRKVKNISTNTHLGFQIGKL